MSNNPQYPGLQPLRPPGPPIAGSMDPQRNFAPPPPMPVQFRPVVPTQPPQQFIPMPSQHYQPVGPGVSLINVGMPPQNQQPQFTQPIQQLHPRPTQQLQMPPQAVPLPVARPDSQAPNGYAPSLGGSVIPISASYTFTPSSYGPVQTNFSSTGQYQPASQNQASAGLSSLSLTSGANLQSNGEKPSITTVTTSETGVRPHLAKDGSTDWIEHNSANGRRFYYNRKTKVSTWEKPLELMTPIEAGNHQS